MGESVKKELLFELIEEHDLKAIRLGTEHREMSFDEIGYIRDFVSGMLPIYINIGGVNARNDINNLLKMGIRGFTSPMVESAYGLVNFIHTLKELTGDTYFLIKKGITIETITAYHNLGNIIQTPVFKELDQLILDRSDFSRSIERDADDPTVYSMMSVMASRLRRTGKIITVGGNIHPINSIEITRRIGPDRIDTGICIIGAKNIENIWTGVKKCLILEKDLYSKMKTVFSYREGFIETLIQKIEHSLNQIPEKITIEKAGDKVII